ncbi:TPA: hypothetical protein TY768_000932 [Streptococcus suis]|nr:hypothetical protein [Streptococcus suis]
MTTKAVSIDVKRTGFPVTIGNIELWFDTSAEGLSKYYDLEAEAQKRLTEIQESVILENLESEIKGNSLSKETVLGAIDLEKKLLEVEYDLIFGDGTFAKLYEQFPDFQALENTLEAVVELIAKRLDELAIERKKEVEKRTKGYTNKTGRVKQK